MTTTTTTEEALLPSKTSTWSFTKLSKTSSTLKSNNATNNGQSKQKRSIVIDQDFFDEKVLPQDPPLPNSKTDGHLSAVLNDDAWEVSVAERRQTGKRTKNEEATFTLYVTTAILALTLTRTSKQLLAFDEELHKATAIPFDSPLSHVFTTSEANQPRKKRQPLFTALSKTLSPTKLKRSKLWSPPLAELEPNGGARSPLAQVSGYLSTLSKLPDVRTTKAWKDFFAVQSANDLESHRVERRVRKIKSDSSVKRGGDTRFSLTEIHAPIPEREKEDNASLKSLADLAAQFLGSEPDNNVSKEDASMASAGKSTPDKATTVESSIVELPPRPATTEPSPSDAIKRRIELPVVISVNEAARARRAQKKRTSLDDFEIIRVLGRGCAGKVLLVRHSASRQLYAMKAIHKHHVLAHRELGHTLTEQSVLKRMAQDSTNPFVVKLWWSFHDKDSLFLVLDFHPGGDLATQLARWGRLGRDRARFYSAEIAEGLTGLHEAGVIYRDLKPENILIGVDGHVVLTDFGLSKQFDRPLGPRSADLTASIGPIGNGELGLPGEDRPAWMTSAGRSHSTPPSENWRRETCATFCGTAEYLAPEVLMGEPYSYECDAWSFGTMLFEMLTGMTPFWAADHTAMYRRVLHDELLFEEDGYLDADTKGILRGLLQKNPLLRMSDSRIRRHPYFSMIDWGFIRSRRYIPPYIPALNPDDELDTSNFDQTFLSMTPVVFDPNEEAQEDPQDDPDKEPKVPQSPIDEHGNDVFCGYSFRGDSDQDDLDSLPSFDETEEHVINHPQHDSAYTMSDGPGSPSRSPPHFETEDEENTSSSAISNRLMQSPTLNELAPVSVPESVPEDKELPAKPSIEEDEWEKVDIEGQEAHNGRRAAKGSTFFARGIADKYVLAVRDAVRATPKRSNSRRGGILGMRSRNGSRSSSSENVNAPLDSPSAKRAKNESSFLASPLKMRLRPSRNSLRNRTGPPSSRRNSTSPTEELRTDSALSENAPAMTPRPSRNNTSLNLNEEVELLKPSNKSKLFGKRMSAILASKPVIDPSPNGHPQSPAAPPTHD